MHSENLQELHILMEKVAMIFQFLIVASYFLLLFKLVHKQISIFKL